MIFVRQLKKEVLFMSREFLAKEAIALHVEVSDWEEAIRRAGDLLINTGKIATSYVDATIQNIHEFGPYILIAPNIALPHARPEDGVNEEAISVLTLKQPVGFDSERQFSIVICLAAVNQNLHIDMLQRIAEVIANEELVQQLLETDSVQAVYSMFNGEVSL